MKIGNTKYRIKIAKNEFLWKRVIEKIFIGNGEGGRVCARRIISIENYLISAGEKGNNCSLTRFEAPIPRIFLALSFFLRVRVWRIANWGKGWLTTVQTLVCLCWPRRPHGGPIRIFLLANFFFFFFFTHVSFPRFPPFFKSIPGEEEKREERNS